MAGLQRLPRRAGAKKNVYSYYYKNLVMHGSHKYINYFIYYFS
jgi:hypothetical protein